MPPKAKSTEYLCKECAGLKTWDRCLGNGGVYSTECVWCGQQADCVRVSQPSTPPKAAPANGQQDRHGHIFPVSKGGRGDTDNWTDDDACDDDPDDGDDPYEDDEQSSTSLPEESTSGSSSDPDESSTPEDEEIEDDPIPYANSKDIFNAIENIWAGKKPKKPGWLKTPGKKKKAGKPKTKAKPKAKKGLGWNGPTLEKKVKDYHKKKAWDKKKSLEKKKAKKDSGWNSVNIEKMLKEHLKKWGQDREDKEVW